jgi:histidine ammonia-lyase
LEVLELSSETVTINGYDLTLEQVIAVARGNGKDVYPQVLLADAARQTMADVRNYIDKEWLKEDSPPVYGFNTGVGKLKDTHITPADNLHFQELMINSHCGATGNPAPIDAVRATMVIRANALAKGVSGIRPVVVERLLNMLNQGVHPVIPELGSVGASGDLAHLAHLVSVLVGHPEAEAFLGEERLPAGEALKRVGLEPVFRMEAKDVLAMINGCTFTQGMAAIVMTDALDVMQQANLACALSMEAFRGELAAFDERIQAARNQPGQAVVASEIRRYLEGSGLTTDEARQIKLRDEYREGPWQPRVQDAYSLRCVPQVHGAVYDVLRFCRDTMEREMNAATDNPLIFQGKEGYEALSGGNFHGEYMAFATDFLAIAVHELGNISERRSARLLDPTMSFGLPRNLVGDRVGLNTGFPVVQCAAAALVSENKTLCFPASADSIPTKSNQEDHVSMATWSARKARQVVENTRRILAIEYLCTCQGISLLELQVGSGRMAPATERAYKAFRQHVAATVEDRYMHRQIQEAEKLVTERTLLLAAEGREP